MSNASKSFRVFCFPGVFIERVNALQVSVQASYLFSIPPNMVGISLVSELRAAEIVDFGELLLKQLDSGTSSIRAAYWMRLPYNEGWVLCLASPNVNTTAPLKLYEEIDDILLKLAAEQGFRKVKLWDIRLFSPQDEMPMLLRMLIKTEPTAIDSHEFSRTTLSGTNIPDCYIYRSA